MKKYENTMRHAEIQGEAHTVDIEYQVGAEMSRGVSIDITNSGVGCIHTDLAGAEEIQKLLAEALDTLRGWTLEEVNDEL